MSKSVRNMSSEDLSVLAGNIDAYLSELSEEIDNTRKAMSALTNREAFLLERFRALSGVGAAAETGADDETEPAVDAKQEEYVLRYKAKIGKHRRYSVRSKINSKVVGFITGASSSWTAQNRVGMPVGKANTKAGAIELVIGALNG